MADMIQVLDALLGQGGTIKQPWRPRQNMDAATLLFMYELPDLIKNRPEFQGELQNPRLDYPEGLQNAIIQRHDQMGWRDLMKANLIKWLAGYNPQKAPTPPEQITRYGQAREAEDYLLKELDRMNQQAAQKAQARRNQRQTGR